MTKPHFVIHWGLHALLKLLADNEFQTVLDIGSGEGQHKKFLEYFDKQVYSVDMATEADYVGDFLNIDFDKTFDAILCSHVLEHQRNVGVFLDKVYSVLKPGGILAIIVPTHDRETLISGHLTSWSVPLLCYNLIMAGFDCSKAAILNTYELSLIVKKVDAPHSERHKNSIYGMEIAEYQDKKRTDISPFENIDPYFPFAAFQGANISGGGQFNWGKVIEYAIQTSKPLPTVESKNIVDTYSDLQPGIILG